ncbi:MAG: acylphosphatase [Balneolaceae bacterium]
MYSQLVQKQILLTGRVQGVGFRYYTQTQARKLGLRGWVRNRSDGRVEVVVQGPQETLDKFLEQLERGPAAASVTDLEIVDQSDRPGEFLTFDVEPTL